MASPEEPDFVQAKHRLEEAKLGLMTAKLEVEFWQQRIQELESKLESAGIFFLYYLCTIQYQSAVVLASLLRLLFVVGHCC